MCVCSFVKKSTGADAYHVPELGRRVAVVTRAEQHGEHAWRRSVLRPLSLVPPHRPLVRLPEQPAPQHTVDTQGGHRLREGGRQRLAQRCPSSNHDR